MNPKEININFFFRKPSENFHSIEELFSNIQSAFPDYIHFKNIFLPYHSGFWGRIKNILFVKKHLAQINHITGDVNYIALGMPKKNTILTVHDIGSILNYSFIKSKIIRLLWFKIPFNRVSKIITISDFSKKEIINNFKVNRKKLIVIPNCVSEKFTYTPKEFNTDKPNILIVGTKENKNIKNILPALKNIKCTLIIIGKLPENQKEILKGFEYINFTNVDFEEVVRIYKMSDLLLFPSIYEGFGMPIIEAQASGIPVITSNLEPMKSVASDGAILVNPYNKNEITDAVLNLINNKELRTKLIANGTKNAKKYTCSAIAEELVNIYTQMLYAK